MSSLQNNRNLIASNSEDDEGRNFLQALETALNDGIYARDDFLERMIDFYRNKRQCVKPVHVELSFLAAEKLLEVENKHRLNRTVIEVCTAISGDVVQTHSFSLVNFMSLPIPLEQKGEWLKVATKTVKSYSEDYNEYRALTGINFMGFWGHLIGTCVQGSKHMRDNAKTFCKAIKNAPDAEDSCEALIDGMEYISNNIEKAFSGILIQSFVGSKNERADFLARSFINNFKKQADATEIKQLQNQLMLS